MWIFVKLKYLFSNFFILACNKFFKILLMQPLQILNWITLSLHKHFLIHFLNYLSLDGDTKHGNSSGTNLDETEDEEDQAETSTLLNNNITEEQKEQINQNLESFNKEKTNFEKEVLKWDEKSNDIVVLSKEMCVIMMDMTGFTRGKGPYRTTSSIIGAAKKISQLGSRLEKLVKELSDSCPDSQSKVELLGYLKKLPLFLNQLNVVSKVKENVFDVTN